MTVKGCATVGKHRTWRNHVDHVVAKTCLFFSLFGFLLLRFVDPRKRELAADKTDSLFASQQHGYQD